MRAAVPVVERRALAARLRREVPLDAEILVKLGDRVEGCSSPLARLAAPDPAYVANAALPAGDSVVDTTVTTNRPLPGAKGDPMVQLGPSPKAAAVQQLQEAGLELAVRPGRRGVGQPAALAGRLARPALTIRIRSAEVPQATFGFLLRQATSDVHRPMPRR